MIDPSTVAGIVVCVLVWLAFWAYFRRPKTWDPGQRRLRRMTCKERRALERRRRTGRLMKIHRQLEARLKGGGKE